MNYQEFAQTVRSKHPGAYDHVDDMTLAKKVVEKYPTYADKVTFDEQAPAAPQQPQGMSFGGLISNAASDVGDIASSIPSTIGQMAMIPKKILIDTPNDLYQTGKQMVQGGNFSDTPVGQQAQQFGSMLKHLPDNVMHPYDHPVKAALDVATVAQGARKLFGPKSAPIAPPEPTPYQPSGLTTKAMSSVFGPSEEAIKARFANPSGIENAAPVSELAQRLPQSLQKLSDQVSAADKSAWGTLRNSYLPEEGAIPKENVSGLIKQAKDQLKVYGGGVIGRSGKQALSTLDSIGEDIQGVGKYVGGSMDKTGAPTTHLVDQHGYDVYRTLQTPKNTHLPEATVKGIIQSLDDNINWDDPTAGPVNSTLETLRNSLDQQLKAQNPQYSKAMVPVSDKLRMLNEAKRRFGVKNVVGEGFAPGTSTESSLSNALGKNKTETQRILKDVGGATGQNYLQDVQNAKYAEQFQPGATRANGSRRVNAAGAVGGAIGTVIGGWPGAAIGGGVGAGIGSYLDTQGGAVAGRIIDKTAKVAPKIGQAVSRAKSAARPILVPVAAATPILRRRENQSINNRAEEVSKQPANESLPDGVHNSPIRSPQLEGLQNPLPGMFMGNGRLQAEPITESIPPTQPLTKQKAREFLTQANGNKDLARELARKAGYSW